MFDRNRFLLVMADDRNNYLKNETKYPIYKRNGVVLVVQIKMYALISCEM